MSINRNSLAVSVLDDHYTTFLKSSRFEASGVKNKAVKILAYLIIRQPTQGTKKGRRMDLVEQFLGRGKLERR